MSGEWDSLSLLTVSVVHQLHQWVAVAVAVQLVVNRDRMVVHPLLGLPGFELALDGHSKIKAGNSIHSVMKSSQWVVDSSTIKYHSLPHHSSSSSVSFSACTALGQETVEKNERRMMFFCCCCFVLFPSLLQSNHPHPTPDNDLQWSCRHHSFTAWLTGWLVAWLPFSRCSLLNGNVLHFSDSPTTTIQQRRRRREDKALNVRPLGMQSLQL